jgi:hypothetical protein
MIANQSDKRSWSRPLAGSPDPGNPTFADQTKSRLADRGRYQGNTYEYPLKMGGRQGWGTALWKCRPNHRKDRADPKSKTNCHHNIRLNLPQFWAVGYPGGHRPVVLYVLFHTKPHNGPLEPPTWDITSVSAVFDRRNIDPKRILAHFSLSRDRLAEMRTDYSLLEAALIGYEHQRELLAVKIAEIQRQLGSAPAATSDEAPKKRVMNVAARKRIALAQRKRWAEFHKTQGAPAKKRMMSAEGRERIAEATRKRWAEFRAAKAAAAAGASKPGKRGKKAAAAATETEEAATS